MPRKSNTQERILEYIVESTRQRGYPPSVREIGAAVGLASTSTVHGHLERLEKKGLLRRDASMPRAMEVIGDGYAPKGTISVPIVGRVAAGVPITAIENIDDHMLLPEGFVGKNECFILSVQGDSMIDAGILNGDLVLVRKQSTVNNGEIAVVLVEDEATVKRFYRENGRYRLKPENPHMEPFFVDECDVQGKVIGLMRTL